MGDRDADRLHHLSTAETLRRLVTEEYGVAVADTKQSWPLGPSGIVPAPLPRR